jgi:hypothetical protein
VALTGLVRAFAVLPGRAAVETAAQPDSAEISANATMAAQRGTRRGRHRTALSWLFTTGETTRRRPP